MAGEILTRRHHELDLEGLLNLVDVLLVHDHVGVSLTDIHREAHLFQWKQGGLVLLNNLESRVTLSNLALFSRVLTRVDLEVLGIIHEDHGLVRCQFSQIGRVSSFNHSWLILFL